VLGKEQPPAAREPAVPEIQSGIEAEVPEEELAASRPLVLYDENVNAEGRSLVTKETLAASTVSMPPESTLHVATRPLPDHPSSVLQVVTVRSPYSFELEPEGESTRFITITQTLTSALLQSSPPAPDTTPLFDFDGAVPDPSPGLLEDIYDDSVLLQPLPTNFINFDQELDGEESVNPETVLPAELANVVKSGDVEGKPVEVEPSFTATPSPELGLQAAQLQYLQLLGAQLTDLQPKVVTLTHPVVTTEEQFETQTLTLGLGGKEVVTTVVTPVGLTTRTGFTYVTTTLGPLAPATTIVSSPVVRNTVLTETDIQQYRILFRNRPITTTLTSTRLVTTMATTYVTETLTLQPAPLLAGILG
jgi:hypothetical protein